MVCVTKGHTNGIKKRGGLLRRRFLSFLTTVIILREHKLPHKIMSVIKGKNPLNNLSLSPCTAAPLYKYGGMLRVASNPSAAVLGGRVLSRKCLKANLAGLGEWSSPYSKSSPSPATSGLPFLSFASIMSISLVPHIFQVVF